LVVGRFRSGTTALWNILRHMPGVRAYYEPCHDSLLEHLRLNTSPDPSHLGVGEYWKEYTPIIQSLPHYYRKEFGTQRLCLSATAEHPELRDYLAFLLSSGASDEVVCLKLNRMDLRLPWLKRNFSDTPLVYIYRNPRDQWVSLFRNQPSNEIDGPYLNSGYDLMIWSANIFPYVPRLGSSEISSSYERHYIIWRLSLALALSHADYIINFDEDLQADPERGVRKLLHFMGRDTALGEELLGLVAPSRRDTWKAYHEAEWFSEIERRCDSYLEECGVLRAIDEQTIFATAPERQSPDVSEMLSGLIFPLCTVVSQCRSVALENTGLLMSSLQHAHEYIAQLEEEVQKVGRDSQAGLQERDRELAKRSHAYNHLADALERLRRESAEEITRHEQMIREKDCFIDSLQQEIAKTVTDAQLQIGARDSATAVKDAYTTSLEQEIEKCRRDAELQLRARDETLEKKDRYIRSLEQKVRILQDSGR
jgi:hypothetical protein